MQANAQASGTVAADGEHEVVVDAEPTIQSDLWGFCNICCDAGVFIGVEGTFLAPISEPNQSVILTDLNTGEQFAGSSSPTFGGGVRTWLGLQREGWGIRFRYWHFSNDAIDTNPAVPINSQPSFEEAFHLDADTIDLELTQRFCVGAWKIDSSFGGRYAQLERNGTVVGYGTLGNGVNLYGLAMGANELEGSGFTFSLAGRKRLGCSPWHFFWDYRGALLWVDATASALTEANAVTGPPLPVGSANSRDQAFATSDHSENVYISEVQVGFEYERCLRCLPATVFLRAGVEYQHWSTGDVFAGSNSFAFLQGGNPAFGGRVDAISTAHDGDLDLLGFKVGGGLTY